MVSQPLSCDKPTYECTYLSYVRVCVELDATKTLLQKFEIHVYPKILFKLEWSMSENRSDA